jgi:hypothetical protein
MVDQWRAGGSRLITRSRMESGSPRTRVAMPREWPARKAPEPAVQELCTWRHPRGDPRESGVSRGDSGARGGRWRINSAEGRWFLEDRCHFSDASVVRWQSRRLLQARSVSAAIGLLARGSFQNSFERLGCNRAQVVGVAVTAQSPINQDARNYAPVAPFHIGGRACGTKMNSTDGSAARVDNGRST